ncbi:SDR family NAD(P)-dependent oxidoreductase [Macrococcus brunensis]|uniref:SDR family NAD(P)-dependent oxidoreductase n=1 Tax=Macrococcus brunensis TaxID=198483 RepID=A0A4V6PPL4_9STAP|nr:SDR family NAD(P)-dependent oxidoreductase [Macrococcus brunensis]TDL97786.1 SDR family NAD(P)-dependent oxidoreductase [Macrococcus brunensis]
MANYLVTGGSGDIGRAIVTDLLEAGHSVVCQYFKADIEILKETMSGDVTFWQCDLTKLKTKPTFIDTLDGLIYAAGTESFGLVQDFTEEQIDQQYHVHLKGLIQLVQWMVPVLCQKQYGRIVVISSIWGETGASMESVYSAMKAGQIGFVKSMAKELALSGVTVNAITPGVVRGRMTDQLDEDLILEDIPQGELVEVDEVAYLVSYLLHKRAQHMTGQVLRLNAGWLI